MLHEIVFMKEKKRLKVPDGTTILQAARTAGVVIETPCDGRGTCGKCRVRIVGGGQMPGTEEDGTLADNLAKSNIILACQAKVYGEAQIDTLVNSTHTFVTIKEGQGSSWPFTLTIQESAWYKPGVPSLGVAVDIGTTSVVAEMFDLETGHSLAVASCLNPQTVFGADVLTRISFAARRENGTKLLQEKIIAGINSLLQELTASTALSVNNIYEIVVAGNTTMLHLLLGINPGPLACAPYSPVFTESKDIKPELIGITMAQLGNIKLLPSSAAFVGADIVAGVLALKLHQYPGNFLFIDIGTNGEIVLGRQGVLIGTSAAAGPALEGMNIACGCRAEAGAIEMVSVDKEGFLTFETIGGVAPRGICGSGLMDVVSELVRVGVIERNGRFVKKDKLIPVLGARLVTVEGQTAFIISEENGIFLSQKDVRQVQLAKGAIVAAIQLLLKDLQINYDDVDEILVAGAFGFHIKKASLMGIGLIPPGFQDKISFVGNTAKEGAKAVLLNRQACREMTDIARGLSIKELSLQTEFQEYFVRELAFPSFR